jgi:hypothetical protein
MVDNSRFAGLSHNNHLNGSVLSSMLSRIICVLTSLNKRECCGAISFILKTVGLKGFHFSGKSCGVVDKPNRVSELGKLVLVCGIELKCWLRIHNGTRLKAPPAEHDGGLDVGILVQ